MPALDALELREAPLCCARRSSKQRYQAQALKCRWPWEQEAPENRFYVWWLPHLQDPAANHVCDILAPAILRPPKRTRSFGHLLRDNFASLRFVAEQLDADVGRLTWVQAPTAVGAGALSNRLVSRYAAWGGRIAKREWADVVKQCTKGAVMSVWEASLSCARHPEWLQLCGCYTGKRLLHCIH